MPEVKIPEPQSDIQYLVWGLVAIVAIFMLSPAIVSFVKSKFSKEETIKPENPTDDHVCHQSGNLMDFMKRLERVEQNQENMGQAQERLEANQDSLEEKIEDVSKKVDLNHKEQREDMRLMQNQISDIYKLLVEKLK